MTPADALKLAEQSGAKMVDFKFVDLLGIWQHTTMPISKLSAEVFKDGYFFDGSSIRGWQPIHASDMIFIPDAGSAVMDPFFKLATLSLTCDIVDAITKQPYSRDPRTIAAKAEAYLKSTGIGDTAYFGPEPEFFVFDEVRYSEGPNRSSYMVDSIEGRWNTDREEGPNLGYKPPHKGGYFPVPPTDTLHDLRADMAMTLEAVGIPVEVFHHEVATGGQCELSMKFNSLKKMADWTMWYKYVVKNVARANGRTATFMPKPIFGDNGSGMHCHQSIWASRTWRSITSAAFSSTPRPSARSPTRERTATSAWCLATRRRSTWPTRRETVRLRSVSRLAAARRRPSASSSVARTRPRIRTSLLRRC
jgi:glutamine synthetase